MKFNDSGSREGKRRLNNSSLQISKLMSDSDSDIDDFVHTLRFNTSLSTAIIETVNRAYSGFGGPIECIARAVQMLGIGDLHSLVNHLSESDRITARQKPEYVLADDLDSTEFKWAG